MRTILLLNYSEMDVRKKVILCIKNQKTGTGEEDCHLAFFWGDTAWDNKFWHSLEDGNQISPLQVENYANTYYLIKTRK